MTVLPSVKQTFNYALDHSFENNDHGAVYGSAEHSVTKSLAQDIFTLGNHAYASVDDLTNNELVPVILPPPIGDSFIGWSSASLTGGGTALSNNGIVPEATFTVWDVEKMALTTSVDYSLLELNGISGHQELTVSSIKDGSYTNKDATIVRSDDPILEYLIVPLSEAEKTATFTGISEDTFSEWPATAPNYQLIVPSEVAPKPDLKIEGNAATNSLDLVWHSVSGLSYSVDYSTNLTNAWLPHTVSLMATQSQTRIAISTATHTNAFYRVDFVLP